MKTGLLGGSFDPVHSGHLTLARHAIAGAGLDRVVFLPTAAPPHKPERDFAPAHRRYTMVELALLHEPRLEASPLELTPGHPAYTVDTVERFAAANPGDELYLVIGADSLLELPAWRRWFDLVRQVRLVVLARPGSEVPPDGAGLEPELAKLVRGGDVTFLDNPPVAASSTRIREMLAAGEEPPAGWLPGLVLDYCRKYDLYR